MPRCLGDQLGNTSYYLVSRIRENDNNEDINEVRLLCSDADLYDFNNESLMHTSYYTELVSKVYS
jgi:hypothetical protein